MKGNKPHITPEGRFIHLCMADDCRAWGAFGFQFGALWLCALHRPLQARMEKIAAQDMAREIKRTQGAFF